MTQTNLPFSCELFASVILTSEVVFVVDDCVELCDAAADVVFCPAVDEFPYNDIMS